MSKAKIATHSPGPWSYIEGDRSRREASSVHKAGDKEFLIAHVICENVNNAQRAEDIANARLIAAAPELLSALLMALPELVATLDAYESTPSGAVAGAVIAARAAITKATGK